jgi:hypothetical protein
LLEFEESEIDELSSSQEVVEGVHFTIQLRVDNDSIEIPSPQEKSEMPGSDPAENPPPNDNLEIPAAVNLSERISSLMTYNTDTGKFEMPPAVWFNKETGEYVDIEMDDTQGVIGC